MPSCFTLCFSFQTSVLVEVAWFRRTPLLAPSLVSLSGPSNALDLPGVNALARPEQQAPPAFPLPPDLFQSCPVMTHVKFFAILSQKVLRYKTLIQFNLEQIAKMSHSLGPIHWVKLLEDSKFVCFTSALHYGFLRYSISVKDFLNCTDNTQRKEASQYYHFFLKHSRSSPHLVLDNLHTGCIQLFRLMFHIKECICKM